MKRLLIAMGCIAAMILTSSCTADSIEDNQKANTITADPDPKPTPETFDLPPDPNKDEKDKTQG